MSSQEMMKAKKKSLNNFFLPFQSPSPSRFLFKLFFLFIIYYEFIFFLAQLNSTLVRTYIHNELNKTKNGSSLKVFGCREGKLRNVKNIDWARIWADNGRAIKKTKSHLTRSWFWWITFETDSRSCWAIPREFKFLVNFLSVILQFFDYHTRINYFFSYIKRFFSSAQSAQNWGEYFTLFFLFYILEAIFSAYYLMFHYFSHNSPSTMHVN